MSPQELQKALDELEASRSSRKRAWENLQELRWVLQDSAGMKLPPPAKKTIDMEGKLIKDGVRKAIQDRQNALSELLNERFPHEVSSCQLAPFAESCPADK